MSTSKHTFFSMVYKGALSGISFISSVLLARALSPDHRVELQYSASLNQTGMTFVGGYTNYYGFALPKHPDETAEIVQMGNLFMFALSLLVWALTFALIFVPTPFFHLPRPWAWALLCLPFTFVFGYGTRLLNAMHQISWLNRANTLQPLVYTVLLAGLFLERHNLTDDTSLFVAYMFWVGSFALAVVVTLFVTYRSLREPGVTRLRFSKKHWLGTVRYGSWSSVAQAVNIANYRMDFWLVMSLLAPREASIYGIAVVASEVLLNVSGSIATVVFRRMTAGSREDAIHITELSTRHTIITSSIVALGMYIVFPWLIRFAYGSQYAAAVWPFVILLPGLVVRAAGNIVIQYATNSLGQPKTSIWMNGVSAIINAIACVVFIPRLGMLGAAVASTVSYVLSFVFYVIWFARITSDKGTALFWVRRSDLQPYLDVAGAMLRKLRKRGRG